MKFEHFVALLMVLTGFCSFGYELVLHYEAVLIVGSSTLTMGIIISMFIFGYLSSFYFGRLVDKMRNPRKIVTLFVILEVCIALLLLIIVPVTRMVPSISELLGWVIGFHLIDDYYLLIITISLLALVIPLLMGGEIPIAMKLISLRRHTGTSEIGRISGLVFAMDSLGAGIGGIVTSVFLIPSLGQTSTSILLGAISLSTALLMILSYTFYTSGIGKGLERGVDKAFKKEAELRERSFIKSLGRILLEYKLALVAIFIGIIIIASMYVNIEQIEHSTIQQNYDDPVVYYKYSRYQQIVIVENPDLGYMMYLNGQLQIAEEDEYQYHEALVHIPMITHPQPRNILIIGGGDGGALEEVLKHDCVEKVVLVELDSEVVTVSRIYFNSVVKDAFDDPKVTIEYEDGRRYVEDYDGDPFDVAIIDLPDPETETVASLYTKEYYQSVEDVMSEDGIMVTQSTSPFEYGEVSMSILKTAEEVFEVTDIYSSYVYSFGPWSFVIGSNELDPVTLDPQYINGTVENRTLTELNLYSASTHYGFFDLMENEEMERAYEKATVSTKDRPVIQKRF